MKKKYIEVLRIIASLAVVMIHICMTEVVNYPIDEIGVREYVIYSIGYTLVRWAVPVFIMITGGLLLDPSKQISERKICRYIARMTAVLLLFGTVYASMEIVFEKGLRQWYLIIPKALINVLQMKSWDHLWYLYFLIGLYIMTPFVKSAVNNMSERMLWHLIVFLYIVTYGISTINAITGLNVSKLLIPVNGYYLLYIVGYYLTLDNNKIIKYKNIFYALAFASIVIMCVWDSIKICIIGDYSHWIRSANCLVPFVAVAIYVFVKNITIDAGKLGAVWQSISECSFGIYLIHPFFINLLYKLFNVTPRSMEIVLGIPLVFVFVFLLSWGTTIILRKIPGLKNLI